MELERAAQLAIAAGLAVAATVILLTVLARDQVDGWAALIAVAVAAGGFGGATVLASDREPPPSP